MAAGHNWTLDETMAAFGLYFILPSRYHHKFNNDVISLADALGRTPSSVALKLANIKANDPMRKGVGLKNGSKLDAMVWDYYAEQGDKFLQLSLETLKNQLTHKESATVALEYDSLILPEGKDRITVTTTRVNQLYFRNALMENYDRRCCVSGLTVEPLLVASHIKPWKDSDPVTERLSPENGLLLDALHDAAFDKGLMTIDFNLNVVISQKVPKDEPGMALLWRYNGQPIRVPGKFKPRREFIEYHNDLIFQR